MIRSIAVMFMIVAGGIVFSPDAEGLDIATSAVLARSPDGVEPGVWDMGYTGRGVTIAILDTGVDDDHPSFQGAYVGGVDLSVGLGIPINPGDTHGHGTHVAGIALGRGGGPNDPNNYLRGMAPDANLVDVKIALDFTDIAILGVQRGLEWCLEHYQDDWGDTKSSNDGIDVISISFGDGNVNSTGDSDVADLITQAVELGMIVVVAAGNDGPDNEGFDGVASADDAITVGTVSDMGTPWRSDDTVAYFSNRGPRADDGDGNLLEELKPDVVAPGISIMSAEYSLILDPDEYVDKTGSSMACPVVSGIAALLLEADPTLEPGEIKQVLRDTAEPRGEIYNSSLSTRYSREYGFGLVNAFEAMKQVVPLPDLTIPALTLSSNLSGEGETITISVTVENVGDDGATDGELMLVARTNESVARTITVIEGFSLGDGKSTTFNLNWGTMDNVTVERIEAEVVCRGQLERDEANNDRDAVIVITPMPELNISGWDQASTVVVQGDPLTANFTIRNSGGTHVSFSTKLTVEGTQVNDSLDLTLEPGYELNISYRADTAGYVGLQNLSFTVTMNYVVPERNTLDNIQNFTVIVEQRPKDDTNGNSWFSGRGMEIGLFLLAVIFILGAGLVLLREDERENEMEDMKGNKMEKVKENEMEIGHMDDESDKGGDSKGGSMENGKEGSAGDVSDGDGGAKGNDWEHHREEIGSEEAEMRGDAGEIENTKMGEDGGGENGDDRGVEKESGGEGGRGGEIGSEGSSDKGEERRVAEEKGNDRGENTGDGKKERETVEQSYDPGWLFS